MSERPVFLPGLRIAPDGKGFPWGPIDAVHSVGDIIVVQYREDKSNSSQPEYWGNHGKVRFHPYIEGKNTHRSYKSLDSALVGAIGQKREGLNSQAALYFDRMTLGPDGEPRS